MTELERSSTRTIEGLIALAQTYFDAAYTMDADKFATIFHEASSVTRRGDGGAIVVTPLAAWLGAVGGLASPRDAGAARRDHILAITPGRNMALLKLKLRIPPREVTDLLSCFFIDGRWQIVQKVFDAESVE